MLNKKQNILRTKGIVTTNRTNTQINRSLLRYANDAKVSGEKGKHVISDVMAEKIAKEYSNDTYYKAVIATQSLNSRILKIPKIQNDLIKPKWEQKKKLKLRKKDDFTEKIQKKKMGILTNRTYLSQDKKEEMKKFKEIFAGVSSTEMNFDIPENLEIPKSEKK